MYRTYVKRPSHEGDAVNSDDQATGDSAQPASARSGFSRRSLLRSTGVLAGAAATAGWLSACSPGSASTGSKSGHGAKRLSLLLLGPTPETMNYITKTVLPAFADSTGISVNTQQSDWGSGFQKVVTAAASGTLPDVLMVGGIWVAPLASKHALLGIDDLLTSYSDKGAFIPSALKDCAYKGTTYALPVYADTRTALYRKSILLKAGADPNNLPRTWDDYAALGKRIKQSTNLASPVDWGADKSVGLQQSYAQLILQAGGTYYDQSGHADFASPQGVSALQYLMSFYRDHLSSADVVNTGTGPSPFVAGNTAMTFSGISAIANAKQNKPAVVDDIIAGLPLASAKGRKPITSAWINKFGIAASTKNRDGAWKLLQHLCSKDVATKLGELYGGLPTRTDIRGTKFLNSMPKDLVAAAQYVVPQPPSPNMLAIAPEINTYMEQAIRLQGTAESILKAMDKKIDQINGV